MGARFTLGASFGQPGGLTHPPAPPSPASNEQRRSQEREGEKNKKCRGLGKRLAFPQPPAPRHFAYAQLKWRRPNVGQLPQNGNAPDQWF